MTELQQKALHQADIRLVLVYALADICESLLKDMEDYQRKAGTALRYEQKQKWNAFLKSANNVRQIVRATTDGFKESYANVCELLEITLLHIIDKCDSEDGTKTISKIISYIDSFPSVRGVEIKYDLEI